MEGGGSHEKESIYIMGDWCACIIYSCNTASRCAAGISMSGHCCNSRSCCVNKTGKGLRLIKIMYELTYIVKILLIIILISLLISIMKKSGIYCLCGIDTISAQGHSQVINK